MNGGNVDCLLIRNDGM